MRLPGIIKALAMPQNSHPCVAEMKGDFKSNEAYCSKQGELVKMGREPAQGQRNDIIAVKRLIDSGKRPMEIADEYEEHFGTVAKFDGFLNRYHSYKRRKLLQDDRSMPDVIIKWGPPRTGKTAWCDDEFGTSGWQRVPGKGVKWFNNCDCDVVLFDDVKINEIPPIGAILELTDRYLVDVDSKYGGLIPWKPKTVVFTSNYHPREWWNLNGIMPSFEAFMSRVKSCEHVTEPYIRRPKHATEAEARKCDTGPGEEEADDGNQQEDQRSGEEILQQECRDQAVDQDT